MANGEPKLELTPLVKEEMMEVRIYRDSHGNNINMATPAFPGIGATLFLGETYLTFSDGVRIPVRFPLTGAKTIDEACDLWDSLCEAACRACIKEMQKQQTRAAILGANGRPA